MTTSPGRRTIKNAVVIAAIACNGCSRSESPIQESVSVEMISLYETFVTPLDSAPSSDGKALYTSAIVGDHASIFRVDLESGQLTQIAGTEAIVSPISI